MKLFKQSFLIITGILSFFILMIVMTGTMAFTEGQLEYGREVYSNNCLSCHGKDGKDGFAPALHTILEKYPTEKALLSYISKNMPIGRAGELSSEEYDAVVYYISSLNKLGEEKVQKQEEPKEEAKDTPKEEIKQEAKQETKEVPKQQANNETKEVPKTTLTPEAKKEPANETEKEPTNESVNIGKEQSNPDMESEQPASEDSPESIEVVTIPSESGNKQEEDQATYVENNNNQATAELGVTESGSSNNPYLWTILLLVISIGFGIFFRQKIKNRKASR